MSPRLDSLAWEFWTAASCAGPEGPRSYAARRMLSTRLEGFGLGIAGVYTFEIAESKVAQTVELAQKAEFPLLCTLEPEEESE